MRSIVGSVLIFFAAHAQGLPPPVNPPRPPTTLPRPQPGRPVPPTGAPRRPAPDPRVRSATGDALDRYAAGAYDSSITTLALLGGFNTPQADDWIALGSKEDQPRRRLVAALAALEYTASRPGLSPGIIEWAADVLRKSPAPQPHERLWLRASVALIEGRGGWTLLSGAGGPGAASRPAAEIAADPLLGAGYLAYVLSRAPDDPYLRLAKAVGGEVEATELINAGSSSAGARPLPADRIDADVIDPASPPSAPVASMLAHTAAALEPLTSDPIAGDEARLRLGCVELRLGRFDRALDRFDHVDAARADPFVGYLTHVYAGWVLAKRGEPARAIVRYQSALAILPNARSATTFLSALYITTGRLDDAERLAAGFLGSHAAADDPLSRYLLGDYRNYASLVGQLREAIR
jgi:tetratricopeptide (TPR) repeat protein